MRHTFIRFVLILLTIGVFGCADSSQKEVQVVKETSIETLVFSRGSNATSVRFDGITQGGVALVPGDYSFSCDVAYTQVRQSLVQALDDTTYIGASFVSPLAQSFRAPATGKIRQVEIKVISGGAGAMSFAVYLYPTLPSALGVNAAPLAYATATAQTTAQWLTVNFSTPVDVTAGTTYYLILRAPSAQVVGWYMDYGTNRLADGQVFSSANGGEAWSSAHAADTAFKVHVDDYQSPTYKYTYNGVSSPVFTTYPAGQQITLDGGAAGVFKFTPLSTPPGSPANISPTDAVSLIVQ